MSRLSFIILFIVISHFSLSQVEYGFKFGVNESVYRVEDFKNEKFKTGFNGGLLFKFWLKKQFFLQSEILYNEKGFKYGGGYKGTIYLDYISLPILYGFKVVDRLSFLAGPEVDFLINEDYKFESGNGFMESYKNFDISIDAGVAWKLNQNLGFDLRYCYGLFSPRKVLMLSPNGVIEKYAGNNRTYQLNVFYAISFRNKK